MSKQEEDKQSEEAIQDDCSNMPEFEEHAEERRNKELLQIIGECAVNCPKDNSRLTWQALYSLKSRQMALNEEMSIEIEKIKDSYQLLKQPIFNQISSAAIGPDSSSLRNQRGSAGAAIPSFWETVLIKAGLLNDEKIIDMDCFKKMKSFTCEYLEDGLTSFRIAFSFREEPLYFANKSISVEVCRGGEGEEGWLKVQKPLKYKQKRDEQSFFTQLMEGQSKESAMHFASQVFQSYRNSLYFYFSKFHTSQCSSEQSQGN